MLQLAMLPRKFEDLLNAVCFTLLNQCCRCITGVIGGSEFSRLEREHEHSASLSNGHTGNGDILEHETHTRLSAEAIVKASMQTFIKFAAGIILDFSGETNRSVLVSGIAIKSFSTKCTETCFLQITNCSAAYFPGSAL